VKWPWVSRAYHEMVVQQFRKALYGALDDVSEADLAKAIERAWAAEEAKRKETK